MLPILLPSVVRSATANPSPILSGNLERLADAILDSSPTPLPASDPLLFILDALSTIRPVNRRLVAPKTKRPSAAERRNAQKDADKQATRLASRSSRTTPVDADGLQVLAERAALSRLRPTASSIFRPVRPSLNLSAYCVCGRTTLNLRPCPVHVLHTPLAVLASERFPNR